MSTINTQSVIIPEKEWHRLKVLALANKMTIGEFIIHMMDKEEKKGG